MRLNYAAHGKVMGALRPCSEMTLASEKDITRVKPVRFCVWSIAISCISQ